MSAEYRGRDWIPYRTSRGGPCGCTAVGCDRYDALAVIRPTQRVWLGDATCKTHAGKKLWRALLAVNSEDAGASSLPTTGAGQ